MKKDQTIHFNRNYNQHTSATLNRTYSFFCIKKQLKTPKYVKIEQPFERCTTLSSESARKISESAINEYMQIYAVFSDRLSKDDFISRIERINWEEGSFLRASSLFMLSQKCIQCERTLALALLCSSIEAMTPKDKQVDFYSWLVKNKLGKLTMKNEREIKENLELARDEWLKQPDREGAFHNFKQFLLDNCPKDLRIPPFEDYRQNNMSFEEALKNIYGEFRSLFIHEGISYASYNISDTMVFVKHVLIVGKHLYFIDLKELVPWFSIIVKESLYTYLTKTSC